MVNEFSAQGILRNSKMSLLILLTFFVTFFFANAYALPFTIVPSSSNPTRINAGDTLTASYTIVNNTTEQRNSNYVKYLPLNVAIAPSGCSSTFNLAPKGQPGDSCVLNLVVTGGVNGFDTNPAHHLLVCFPTGITCNGPATPLNITVYSLQSLALTPLNPQIAKGLTQQFSVIAHFTDGLSENYTSRVAWHSSNPAVAPITSSGLSNAYTIGTTNITATYGNASSNISALTVLPAALVSIAVTPTSPSVNKGATQQFTALGTYTDGTTVDLTSTATWKSSNIAIAAISSTGVALGTGVGTANITATVGAITSNTAVMTVLPPLLVQISVTPTSPSILQGGTQQFVATGIYGDGSTQTITTSVTWSSSNTIAATINSSGLATGLIPTTITPVPFITASLGSVTSNSVPLIVNAILSSIAITPLNPNIPNGLTTQYSAIGTYSDGSTLDITTSVTWVSSFPTNGTIVSGGLATAKSIGSTTITATLSSITSNQSLFTILPPILTSIAVTPDSATVAQNGTVQFTATGTYSDTTTRNLSSLATWTSSVPASASINATGLATAHLPTSTNPVPYISATYQSVTSNLAPISITPALLSITVTPPNPSITLGNTEQFTAIATYSDSSTINVTATATWHSATPAVATINASGLAYSVTQGSSVITASVGAVTSNTSTLTVTAPALVSIAITPLNPSVPKGHTQQFVATGTYSNSSTQVITGSVTWHSSNTASATIAAGGLATPVSSPSSTTITATSGAITSNATTLTVNAFAYITGYHGTTINVCPINVDGTFGTCTQQGNFTNATSVVVNSAFTFLYVLDTTFINYCVLNLDGTIGTCTAVASGSFVGGTSISINPPGTFLYVADASEIQKCPITGGAVGACVAMADSNNGEQISFNPGNTIAYVPNNVGSPPTGSNILSCPVQAGGTLGSCTVNFASASGEFYYGSAVNSANTVTYVSNGTNTIYYCAINGGGTLGSCPAASQTFPGSPFRIVLNNAGTFAYIVQVNTSLITGCSLNPDSTFNTCQTATTDTTSMLFNGIAVTS